MAGARTWQESGGTGSGIVTGLELRNLDLRGTKLVTLSACPATQLQHSDHKSDASGRAKLTESLKSTSGL